MRPGIIIFRSGVAKLCAQDKAPFRHALSTNQLRQLRRMSDSTRAKTAGDKVPVAGKPRAF